MDKESQEKIKYHLKRLKELGYRKPLDKPPLLSDKEILAVWSECGYGCSWGQYARGVAQAQMEADIKYYEGGE